MRKLVMLVCFVLVFSVLSIAQETINFAWDLHPEAATIDGFKLYQSKQSGVYTSTPIATFSPGTLVTGSIPKPLSFGRYYYVLTAFDMDTVVIPNVMIESDYSNEVSLVIKPKPPKLNTATQVALAIKGALVKVAGVFRKDKNLRIVE